MTMRRRVGFTFIEIMIVMTVIGLIAAMAVPKYIDLKRRASTTQVIGDFGAVRVAVMSFFADSAYFPADAGAGVMPAGLQKYLPIGFKFQSTQWTLKYENWPVGGGAGFTNSANLIGVTVITQDPRLGETTSRLLGNVPQVSFGNSYTFMISGM